MEDKTKFQLRGLPIPNFLYKETRLSLISLKVYCFIHAYTNPFYFSNDHLAEMFNCHPDTISTSIGQLEKFNYITTEYRTKSEGGKIRLCLDTVSEKASTPSRDEKSEAPTRSTHPDKESKEEKLKNNDVFYDPFKERREARMARKLKKGKVLGSGYKTVSWEAEKPKSSNRDFTPLSDVELWELAKELNVPPYEPIKKQKEILEQYEDGSLPEKYGNSLTFVIKRFIRRGKDTGQIETLDQMGRMALEADHPDRIAERERIWREAEEKGVI